MRKSKHDSIRSLLRERPDGLMACQIAMLLPILTRSVTMALRKMPDSFIDRWDRGVNGRFKPIYCVADIPEDCPHPRSSLERI